jgi:predicted outer membrane protein
MTRVLSALVMAALVATPATAQQQQPPQQHRNDSATYTGQSYTAGSTSTSSDSDRLEKHIASCLILANLKEQELSKFVKDKIDNDEVEDFAKKMAKEHRKFVSDLEEFAPEAAKVKLSEDEDDDNDSKSSHYAKKGGKGDKFDRKLITLQRRAAENCLKMVKEEMKDKDDDELAKAYVGQQISAHIGMLAQLEAAERSASRELKDVIKDAKSKTEDHLDEAKDLMKELKDS